MTDKRDAFARDAFNDALAELAGEGARLGSAAPCTRLVVVVKKEVKPRTMSSTAAEREKVGRFG